MQKYTGEITGDILLNAFGPNLPTTEQVRFDQELCFTYFGPECYAELRRVIIVCRNAMVEHLCRFTPNLNVSVANYYFGNTAFYGRQNTSVFERCVSYIMSNQFNATKTRFYYALFIRSTVIIEFILEHLNKQRQTIETIKDYVDKWVEKCFEHLVALNTSGGAYAFEGFVNPNMPLDMDLLVNFYRELKGDERDKHLKTLIEYAKRQFRGSVYSSVNRLSRTVKLFSQAEILGASGLFPCKDLDFYKMEELRSLYLYPRREVLPVVEASKERVILKCVNPNYGGTGIASVEFLPLFGPNMERNDNSNAMFGRLNEFDIPPQGLDRKYFGKQELHDRREYDFALHFFKHSLQPVINPLTDGPMPKLSLNMDPYKAMYMQAQQQQQQQQHQQQQQQQEQLQQQEEMQRQQEEMQRQQASLAREEMINQNRKLLPPSTMTPMGQLKFWWNKQGGRRSKKKGKKGTRRHSKKKSTRRH